MVRVTAPTFRALPRTGMVINFCFYAPAEIERFTQRARTNALSCTDRFTGAAGKFSHRLSVTFHEFNHDIERFLPEDTQVRRVPTANAREAKWR